MNVAVIDLSERIAVPYGLKLAVISFQFALFTCLDSIYFWVYTFSFRVLEFTLVGTKTT